MTTSVHKDICVPPQRAFKGSYQSVLYKRRNLIPAQLAQIHFRIRW